MASFINIKHYLFDFKKTYGNPVRLDCLDGITDHRKTFIFNNCNRRTATSSMEGLSVSTNANDLGLYLRLESETMLEVYNPHLDNYNMWRASFETWEYTGPDGGDNEFIVRGYHEETLDGVETATVDVSSMNINDYTKVVPIINGIVSDRTNDAADSITAIAYMTDNDTLVIKRGAGDTGITGVGVVLVEFTGSNWTIRQGSETSGADNGLITLDSPVNDWENAFIIHQFKANSAANVDDAIADTSAIYYPYTTDGEMQKVRWWFHSDHVDSVGDSIHYMYVIENPEIKVYRKRDTQNLSTFMFMDFELDPKPHPDETSFMVSRYSSGSGVAYPRGWVGAYYGERLTALHVSYGGNTIISETQLISFGSEVVDKSTKTYKMAILNNVPIKNYWTFQNSYRDFGLGETFYVGTANPPYDYGFTESGFKTRTHSYNFFIDGNNSTSTQYVAGCNLAFGNWDKHEKRSIGGWIMIDSIQKFQVILYKEGGGANNIAFLLGFGNKLMIQVDQSTNPPDYVQVYSDFSLKENRPYHILLTFDAVGDGAKLYIDGKEQTNTYGNPWSDDNLASHTGPVTIGTDSAIDVGGPDLSFYTPTKAYYSDWVNTDVIINDDYIKFYLVEHGLPALVELPVDEENGETQAELDNYSGQTLEDYPLAFRIPAPKLTSKIGHPRDLTLEADNIIIPEETTYDIQWLGTRKLTWKNKNGSNIRRISSLFGGEVEIINQVEIIITTIDARTGGSVGNVHIYIPDIDYYGETDANGHLQFYEYVPDTIIIKARKASSEPFYKPAKTVLQINGDSNSIVIPMIEDK